MNIKLITNLFNEIDNKLDKNEFKAVYVSEYVSNYSIYYDKLISEDINIIINEDNNELSIIDIKNQEIYTISYILFYELNAISLLRKIKQYIDKKSEIPDLLA